MVGLYVTNQLIEASLDRQNDDKIPQVSSAAFDAVTHCGPMLTTQRSSNVDKAARILLISAIQYNPQSTEGTRLSRFQSREQCATVDFSVHKFGLAFARRGG